MHRAVRWQVICICRYRQGNLSKSYSSKGLINRYLLDFFLFFTMQQQHRSVCFRIGINKIQSLTSGMLHSGGEEWCIDKLRYKVSSTVAEIYSTPSDWSNSYRAWGALSWSLHAWAHSEDRPSPWPSSPELGSFRDCLVKGSPSFYRWEQGTFETLRPKYPPSQSAKK